MPLCHTQPLQLYFPRSLQNTIIHINQSRHPQTDRPAYYLLSHSLFIQPIVIYPMDSIIQPLNNNTRPVCLTH